VLCLVTALSISARVYSADEKARLEGTVSDPSGDRISNARVSLRDEVGTAVYQTQGNRDGEFVIDNIATGSYGVIAEAPGFAQQTRITVEIKSGATERITIQLDPAAVSDYLVVSASRAERPLSQVEESVSLIPATQLRIENQMLVSEPLRSVPGLAVAQTGGRGGITSVFARGGESDYNKVLIDGVPVNAAGGGFDFSSLTTENLDRVEIARGPGSALFGSDAMTSVIQLITQRGSTETPLVELSGEGGSFASHRETARLSGLAGWFDYSGSFGYQSIDGRFRNSDFLNRSLSGNFGFRLSPAAQLRITSRWNDNTLGVPGPTAVLFADPDHRQKHQDISVGAGLEWRASPRWYQTGRFIYSEFNTNSFDPLGQDLTQPQTPPGGFNDFAFSFIDHQKRSGVQYQAVVALGTSNVLTAGVDFDHESAVFTDDFSRVSPERNNVGIYVQDQFAWRDRLFLTAGVRIEHNSGDVPEDLASVLNGLGSPIPEGDVGFGFSANPKIAAAYILRKHNDTEVFGATRLRGSFGTGIKEPRLDEAFSPSFFFLGNPLLEPERVISFEVGLSQELFRRRGSVEVTYFDNRFRDQIAFVSDPLTFGPIELADGRMTNFVNLEKASARGIELIAAARPSARLRIGGSYTFLDSEITMARPGTTDEEGLPLLRRPRHSGAIQASWVASRYDLSVDGSFVGQRRDGDPVFFSKFDPSGQPIFNDGYAKVNFAGSYHFARFVTAFARVENLLNQDYEEVLGFPAYRLNFTAGLRFSFGGGQ
jgi:outer membrane cobalamin receptor